MWHDTYAGQALLLCHATCWILLRSAGTAWATLPVSRWTASQWVQGYAEFVRAITCHHVPWRAMEPWCDEICWLSSPHCQVHKVIPGRWLFEVRSMQKRNGWKEMEHAATPSHLLKSYPPFLEKSIKSMNRIARVYSNRTNMAQICANSESMLALSVHPEAIASGFASSVGGPEMAVERDFTGFPVAKVAFLLDLVALVSKSAVEVVAFTISPCYSLRL